MQMLTLNGNGGHAPAKVAAPRASAPPKTLEVATPDAATLRTLTYQAMGMGRVDDARVILERAMQLHPYDLEFLSDAAAIELRAGNAPQAVRLADRALALAPDHSMSAFTRAFGLSASGRIDEARSQLMALVSGPNARQFKLDQPALADLVTRELAHIASPATALAAAETATPTATATATAANDAPAQVDFPLAARFDVIVKFLYALQRLGQLPAWVNCDVRAMYARHIQLRAGGAGTPDAQPSIESSIERFDALIDSMAENGFDTEQPIPISTRNGVPCDGSHRCAAALALGLVPAFTESDAKGQTWDLPWFQRHGFTAEECNVMLRTWAALRGESAHVAILWSPAQAAWPAIETELGREMTIVGARTIQLPRTAFDEMVRDVYSLDAGPQVGSAIENKIRLLGAYAPRVRIVFAERLATAPAPRTIERRVCDLFDGLVPASWLATLHLSDSARESRHLMDLLASETNLAMLRKRRELDPLMTHMLVRALAVLGERGLSADDCCVVGDSVSAVLGLYASDHVDITLRHEVRNLRFDAAGLALGPQLDLAEAGYARTFADATALSDDTLIDNPDLHFRVRGLRFAHPSIVLTRKQHERCSEELSDLALLAGFLDR